MPLRRRIAFEIEDLGGQLTGDMNASVGLSRESSQQLEIVS